MLFRSSNILSLLIVKTNFSKLIVIGIKLGLYNRLIISKSLKILNKFFKVANDIEKLFSILVVVLFL